MSSNEKCPGRAARPTPRWILIARRWWFNYTSNRPFPANDNSTTISPWNYCTPVLYLHSLPPPVLFPVFAGTRAAEKRQKAERKKKIKESLLAERERNRYRRSFLVEFSSLPLSFLFLSLFLSFFFSLSFSLNREFKFRKYYNFFL